MSKTATTQGGGTIPAQPGPRGAAGPARRGPDSGIVSAEGDMSDASGPEAHGADSDVVILGAGPTGRPGERATVRLREAAPDDPPRYAPEWLELREGADAAARAHDLLDPLRIRLANLPGRSGGLVIHDLGCGTGSMGRWLAPTWTAPSTGSCTTATPTCCTSPPSPPLAPPPTAAASPSRPAAATSAGSPPTPCTAPPW